LVFAAPGTGLLQSHAMLPTPLVMHDRIRVFFAACDEALRGRVFRVDLDLDDPRRVVHFEPAPVLDPGPRGHFDADGVNPSQIVERNGKILLYYIGWERLTASVPYRLFAGLATSGDAGATFQKAGTGQILYPADTEPFFRTAPFVYRGPDGWNMLYIGGGEFFDNAAGKRLPTYHLCSTHSDDGYHWDEPSNPPLLSPARDQGQIGFGRPVLWNDAGQTCLLVSLRTEGGYSLSSVRETEGSVSWTAPLQVPAGDWESEMTCFGAPCRAGDWEYLFYNGNRFGATGFGVARRKITGQADPASRSRFLHALANVRSEGDVGKKQSSAMKFDREQRDEPRWPQRKDLWCPRAVSRTQR
jgi:hypothetical protein